mmetsp:Transcript_12650/g.26827  ORF Transcript_12650/g.26827 Transcript_12650/m.26827 type:complete len:200 (+) Transcript_12650:263-862(+)
MFCTARFLPSRSTAGRISITGHSRCFTSSSPSLSVGRRNTCYYRKVVIRKQVTPPLSLRSMTSKVKSTLKQDLSGAATAKTRAGSGKVSTGTPFIKNRGPVSWPSLLLVGIAAASVVAYYNIERERRLESAMGRVVSSESGGWSPNPGVMAPRKFKLTPWGYFPEDDGFGPCKLLNIVLGFDLMTHSRNIFFFLSLIYI